MELKNLKNIYFIGIGGIGMSALARWFLTNGFLVAGYDKTSSELTQQLSAEGMNIHYEDDLNLIPKAIFNAKKAENLIIYTPAVPAEHSELVYFRENQYTIMKRAEVLGLLTRNFFSIGIAGTHGKTTTSSMLAHILQNARQACTAFLGGILKNYDSNLLLSERSPEKTWVVVEADEYDKSFLQLSPAMAVITSMDADHLDIYGDKSHIDLTFNEFAQRVNPDGKLFLKKELNLNRANLPKTLSIETYAVNESADYYADNVQIKDGRFYFDWQSKEDKIEKLSLEVVGFHNVENATVAIAIARNLGITPEEIRAGIASFQGAKRRFDFIIRQPNLVFVDDYAHHPTEIKALLTSARALYPDKKLTVIFQPHLFSRTRDFMDDFAESLALADELLLLDIYPAREKPIEGITSAVLLDKINIQNKILCSKDSVLTELKNRKIEVLFTVGAGDIDRLILPIKEFLLSN